MRRRRLVALTAGLAACSPPEGQRLQPSTPASSSPGPQPGMGTALKPVRGGTLTVAVAQEAMSLDPVRVADVYSSAVLNAVVDTLYEVDRGGNVVGRLVAKTATPQPHVYVLTLRQGVRFHDGAPVDGAAVRFNLQRHLTDPASPRRHDVAGIAAVDVLDAATVRLTLRRPNAALPAALTGGAGWVLNPAAVRTLGAGIAHDLTGAGSGPFRFVEWVPGAHVLLERNADYWRSDAAGFQLPYLDRLVYTPGPMVPSRGAALQAGSVDALLGLFSAGELAALRRAPQVAVRDLPGLGWNGFVLNTRAAPFTTAAARRAISYALDRNQLLRLSGMGARVLATPISTAVPWAHNSDARYLAQDLDRARQALAAAGAPDGFRFDLQVARGSASLQQLAEAVRDQLATIGVEVEIRYQDFATLAANGRAGAFRALAFGWGGGIDPDDLSAVFATGAGANYGQYSNPQVDRLLDAARETADRTKRAAAYRQVQQLLLDDQPVVVYAQPGPSAVARTGVQNYPQTYNGFGGSRDFDTVWKT